MLSIDGSGHHCQRLEPISFKPMKNSKECTPNAFSDDPDMLNANSS